MGAIIQDIRQRRSRPVEIVPVVEPLDNDIDPLEAFRRLNGRKAFLLESAETGGKSARYSFIGAGDRTIRVSGGHIMVDGEDVGPYPGGPVAFLKDFMAQYRCGRPVYRLRGILRPGHPADAAFLRRPGGLHLLRFRALRGRHRRVRLRRPRLCGCGPAAGRGHHRLRPSRRRQDAGGRSPRRGQAVAARRPRTSSRDEAGPFDAGQPCPRQSPDAGQRPLPHDEGAVHGHGDPVQGVHPGRGRFPDRALPASGDRDGRRPRGALPHAEGNQPVAVHVFPRVRRRSRSGLQPGDPGEGGGRQSDRPPHRRHPAARQDRRRRRRCWKRR